MPAAGAHHEVTVSHQKNVIFKFSNFHQQPIKVLIPRPSISTPLKSPLRDFKWGDFDLKVLLKVLPKVGGLWFPSPSKVGGL